MRGAGNGDRSGRTKTSTCPYQRPVKYHPARSDGNSQENAMKQIVITKNAPAPVGPYSQAIKVDGWVYVSGQIPIDPQTGRMIEGDIAAQTRRVLENVREVLAVAGAGLPDVVKTTVYMKDLGQFAAMNEVYAEFFGNAAPARATVQVSELPKNSLLEIECIAHVG